MFPNTKLDCKYFIFGNFDNFHIEMLRDKLISMIIPRQITKLIQDQLLSKESKEYKLIEHLTSKPPAYATVWKWIHTVGFKQDTAKKYYYIDGHEKPEQQKHRSKFINEHVSEIEPRCHRWVHLTNEELDFVMEQIGQPNL